MAANSQLTDSMRVMRVARAKVMVACKERTAGTSSRRAVRGLGAGLAVHHGYNRTSCVQYPISKHSCRFMSHVKLYAFLLQSEIHNVDMVRKYTVAMSHMKYILIVQFISLYIINQW